MTPRTAARVSWTVWILATAAIALGGVLSTLYPFSSIQETFDPIGEMLWACSWLGFGLVGALIVSRRPDNRIGWLLVGITFMLAVGVLTPVYGRVAFQNPASGLPLGPAATWVAMWAITLVFGGVVALLLLFPSGVLESARRRLLGWSLAAAVAASAIVEALSPAAPEGDSPPFNPLGLDAQEEALDAASGVAGPVFGIVAALVLLDFIYRFWRSRGAQRQQFKWMVLAAGTFPALFMAGILLEQAYLDPNQFDPVVLVFFLCGNGLAAAIGIAITRHGLYEINRVVSRSVSYILLTAVLVGLYLAAVTVLTTATAPVTRDSPIAVAAATLLAAAAFRPARAWIQAGVDRRFNRSRYDAAQMVDTYRGRLRDEVDLEALANDLLQTITATMQPAGISLWLAGHEKSSAPPTAVTVPERRRETKGT